MNKGKICVSVCAETGDEMIANVRRAEELADVIEVRFDCLRADELETAFDRVESIKPLLATFRSSDQGGKSTADLNTRRTFWGRDLSKFWAVDLEEDIAFSIPSPTKSITSFHDLKGVPDDLANIFSRLSETSADLIKIAVTPDDVTGALPVWKLIKEQGSKKNIIPIAMGDAGKWTRVLSPAYGAFMTYASLDEASKTADGQITARDLTEVYRVKDLDRDTQVYGVLGDPVSSSLSPYMHNPAFAAAGINAVFIPFLVKDLDAFIRSMVRPETREVELNFAGFSVTMPHKQNIINHLDAIDPTAEKIGAVNTVKIDGGKLTGYNTDAHGFITSLKANFGEVKDARVGVFGAGGAARACVYALEEEGADVTIFARDISKGKALANDLNADFRELSDDCTSLVKTLDVIVNATPLGMKGPLEDDSLFTADQLSGVKFVYDLVTRAVDTPILAEAKKAGVPAIGGLEMLIEQGLKQFEIWTGRAASAEIARENLLDRLRKR